MPILTKDTRAYQEWQDLCEQIRRTTLLGPKESAQTMQSRIDALKIDFVKFCKYYFPTYMDSEFGWFHLKAAKEIESNKNIFAILEWPREHAKSVFAQIMIPMYLYARGELSGMITVSANEDKAITLLSDLQAQFSANQRWINDFGELAKLGDWREGAFATTDGIGFWAYGRGQSPRGARKANKRPNYACVDDIDDKVLVKNQMRVKETVDWVMEDLYGALALECSRVVVCGNRIHKSSVLAHLVGDINEGDPKRGKITHIKVFAIEHKNTHTKADPKHKTSQPAWKERYSIEQLLHKFSVMGTISSRREYFHEHHAVGHVFKPEWIEFVEPLKISKYNSIVTYCDPSFKDSKTADYKAILTVGFYEAELHILEIWVRQASTVAMVGRFYDTYETYENYSQYYMETSMVQDLLLRDFHDQEKIKKHAFPLRRDDRKKPDKYSRIENLTAIFERGKIKFARKLQGTPDFKEFETQLLDFPFGHDDGPDALEGAIFKGNKISGDDSNKGRHGKYNKGNSKYN